MAGYSRYAVYYAPPEGPLAAFGAAWLGWDAVAGRAVAQPRVAGLDMAALTAAPRKYGFHGTIKPPFRLVEGQGAEALAAALGALCATAAPVVLAGLRLARIGRFLALVPEGDAGPLAELAARVVAELDGFRAPAGAEELARRRGAGLTARQDALLLRWGYPYVQEEFRFHLTLSGKLEEPEAARAEAELAARLDGLLPRPFRIGSLCLFGEAEDGRFHLIRREPLGA
ncbi:DUF1045 domain-containing protein [Vannielia litorea]|uniref:Putative phosphonate metabolism protein n=1 Tax=Vannielia litorea TaxID=1217970 RepID=A0A1N6HE34_9RHOB|nr:DUF1045 domain-containing protein [Vannielia litorea]SIO18104.1 putative phosphonate metabolism protein [Vannielia litorea]